MLNTYLDLALLCHPLLAFLTVSRPESKTKMAIQNSRLQYFLLSFLSILAVRYASTLYVSASVETVPDLISEIIPEVCQSVDQPNPIASLYPNNATGTLNGTIAIIPITLDLARSIIPSQYRILEHAYRALLPTFPSGMYPALLQAVHDHEVQAFGFKIPDFSRASIEFPFLDLLADNSTSFKWAPTLLMTAGHEVAIQGAKAYGTTVFESAFDPPCDAYRAVAGSADSTSFTASASEAHVDTTFTSTSTQDIPLSFFKNVTNQITFADGKSCDNMIRMFDTKVSTAPNKIESVKGTVKAKLPPFSGEQEWEGVYGLRFDSAFIENNYLPCENFRGYGSST